MTEKRISYSRSVVQIKRN